MTWLKKKCVVVLAVLLKVGIASPICEVIECDNNVFVAIVGGGITSHVVDAPFTKGARSKEWMKERRWCLFFVGVKMTFLTSSHGMNAIVETM
jgi:hypothetical protein